MIWTQAEGTTGDPQNNTPINLFAGASLSDPDNNNASELVMDLYGIRDANSEVLNIGNSNFLLDTAVSGRSVAGGFTVDYTPAERQLSITPDGADVASLSDFEALVQGITYNNTSARPSENRSLSFDGENDYIAIADSDQLDLVSNFSLEAWIKPTAAGSGTGGNSGGIIINKDGAYQLARFADGSIACALEADGGGGNRASWVNTGLTTALNDWSHVALVHSGTTVNVYLNGGTAAGGQSSH